MLEEVGGGELEEVFPGQPCSTHALEDTAAPCRNGSEEVVHHLVAAFIDVITQ